MKLLTDQLNIISVTPNGSLVIGKGGTAQFNITASGVGMLSYWWRKRGVDELPDKVVSEDTATLIIPAVDESDGGEYYCIVTNMWGRSVESGNVSLTVGGTSGQLHVCVPSATTL